MSADSSYSPWGRLKHQTQRVIRADWRQDLKLEPSSEPLLAFGKGRSYGDSCLNDSGSLLDTSALRHFEQFDPILGVLRCEAGVTIGEILEVCVPKGWFVPVTPGTKFVTLAGAIANDVHGKNHHRAGTFGCHVREIELLRSDGTAQICSPTKNPELFSATIGGLGLTGVIVSAEIQLAPVLGPYIDMESIKFYSLDEFLELSKDSDQTFEYTVAWLDCTPETAAKARGIFMRGNHAQRRGKVASAPLFRVPCDAPNWLLNEQTVRAFNRVYFGKQFKKLVRKTVHYNPFFYPLDSVLEWNRVYGTRGFYQFQGLVPRTSDDAPIRLLLEKVFASRKASFLTVIKEFGEKSSPGMLSFPRPGITVCLDFANDGVETLTLLKELERITVVHGGAMYPAKDAKMSAASFKQFFPRWKEFEQYVDPRFSSNFWRRVTEDGTS